MVDGSWHDLPVYPSTLLPLGDHVLLKVAVSCAWLTGQSYKRVLFVTVSRRPFLAAGLLLDNR